MSAFIRAFMGVASGEARENDNPKAAKDMRISRKRGFKPGKAHAAKKKLENR
jgi:hypothetical protein